jgi:hypothetical protein
MTVYDVGPVGFIGKSHVTDALGSNHPEVGTRMRDGDEEYIWVYNNGGSTISIGKGAVLTAVTGYSVTVSSTTNLDFLVGVCKHVDIATTQYGWLVTKGFTSVEMEADNSAAAGVLLTLGEAGEFAHKSNATATGYQSPAFGKAMEAIASAASGQAYISVY